MKDDFTFKCDRIVNLKSNPVSFCQKQNIWHWKDVDMTSCTIVESMCKYSTYCISKLSHIYSPSIDATCVKLWNKDWYKLKYKLYSWYFHLAIPLYRKKQSLLRIMLNFLPLAFYRHVCWRVFFIFWGKTANLGLKIWITQLRKGCKILCPK